MRLRFAQCIFDSETRELLVEGVRRDLSPRAFQLLELLIEARPRALGKSELMDRLWPDEIVSESSLPRLVAEVRSALGDDAKDPRFVRTLHTFGYSFVCEAVPEQAGTRAEDSSCHLLWGERRIALRPGENLLGRDAEARVPIDLGRVSRKHARIVVGGERAILEDLASKNGTFLRGRRIDLPVDLQDGDEIGVGPAVLVFRKSRLALTTQTGSQSGF
ncbi:MAG: FHA domain-containing protein [Vicinamibacteria bacterium]|nr:FHA domain-containing protein [Vicinamibacteria bacterium]